MADTAKRLPENVAGEFFVDSTCIDCDTCRQLAPGVFTDAGEYSYVYEQPAPVEQRRAAFRALVACPTASIGAASPAEAREAAAGFPLPIEGEVWYCGYTSEKSFGGSSYFVIHPAGNWLVDAPRFNERLARRFEEMGGIRYMFLTHRDDVADAARYAARFHSTRIIHEKELRAQPGAERVLTGMEPVDLGPEFKAIPTPGHTAGHCVLLYRDRFLFSGDHVWWSRRRQALSAGRSVCWYSWPEQIKSMARLAEYTFEWVLPGHGERALLPAAEMRRQVLALSA